MSSFWVSAFPQCVCVFFIWNSFYFLQRKVQKDRLHVLFLENIVQ